MKHHYTVLMLHWKPALHISLLQRVDESAVVYGGRVDELLDELSVTVSVGCGDVDEDLQVLHPVRQGQHLLRGQDVQLHRISEREKEITHLKEDI